MLQSADNREFDIIDGQQRMTTLSLLMLAAISHLTDLAAPEDPEDPQFRRARQLRGNYIGYLDPVSLVPRSKLTLNRHDDGFYQNYLVPLERLPRRGLNPSEHLLRRAFAGSGIGSGNTAAMTARRWRACRYRGGQVVLYRDHGDRRAECVHGVRDPECTWRPPVRDGLAEELPVFPHLRGKRARIEIRTLENRWEGIVGFLGSESFPEFLRIFWNSRNRLVRKFELFKTIRGQVRDKAGAFALIRDMDRHARVYAALRSPEDDAWTMQERGSLAQLQMFNVRQPLAVLLAAFDRFEQEDRTGFERFLRAIAVVSFRYNVICGRQSNEQEMLYNDIARGLSTGRIAGVAERDRGTASGLPVGRGIQDGVCGQDVANDQPPQQEGRAFHPVPDRGTPVRRQPGFREREVRHRTRVAGESGGRLGTVR